MRQLSSGHIYSMFQFTTYLDENIFQSKVTPHFNLFPKSFAEIISAYDIVELHLSLTQGRWRYNQWSYPIRNAPTGIFLWIWFHPELNMTAVDENWKGVVHALSGQFCSSLNFITKEFTAKPTLLFKPQGLWNNKHANADHLRYALLPRETVCTENLTPWKKLLPCNDHAGFASLLHASKLFDSSYVSLGVDLRSVCRDDNCAKVSLELKQTISIVFDSYKQHFKTSWSLKELFDSKMHSVCPVANVSNLLIDLNNKNIEYHLTPSADRRIGFDNSGDVQELHVYDMKKRNFSTPFDISVDIDFHEISNKDASPYVLLHKFTTGFGVEMGGIVCLITNTHPQKDIKIIYFDVIPYYVHVYLHTLKITINNIEVSAENLRFMPGYQGDRPAYIEFILTIPAMATASISIQFEKVFLDWMQYKPDAHHGFYLGSSVVSAYFPDWINSTGISEQCFLLSTSNTCLGSSQRIFRRIFSTPLLIRVPLPDFSMPYNVLCLTCTVIAIGFGSIYNLSTKTFQLEPTKKKKTLTEKIGLLKEKLQSAFVGGKLFVFGDT